MMNILFLGSRDINTTSYHRASALMRLGNQVSVNNPEEGCYFDFKSKILSALHYRSGYKLVQNKVYNWLKTFIENTGKIDLIWVDGGELLGPKCLKLLKLTGKPIVLYNVDDPTGKRDGRRFDSLKNALPFYDLVVVVRKETAEECKQLGAVKVLCVSRGYDEVGHKPFDNVDDIPDHFRSDVAFVGTCIPKENRDTFLLELIENNIPVSIWGDAWEKSKNYNKIKPYIRGSSIYGKDYIAAIQGSKICIGMLSKGNRDLHTTRSFEIPFIGGLFCAQRTSEHTHFYRENEDAVFWDDASECVEVCKKLLANDKLREEIRLSGMQRVRDLKVGNEDMCRHVLDLIFARVSSQ